MKQLFVAIALLLDAPTFGAELTPAQIFRAASPSIVVVETYAEGGNPIAQGSGVSISNQQVVTNCHVFKDASSARVIYLTRSLVASLVLSDVERDLCILKVSDLTAPAAKFGSTASLQVGERAYAIGAPQGFTLTLTDGLISSLRPVSGGNVIQTSAAISPGSSGGGLFNDRAELVGITTLYFKDSPQLNFAVPVEWIYELPQRSKTQNSAANREAKIETEAGAAALDSLEKTLQLLDPIGYERRRPEFERKVVEIGQSLPPSQWEDAARQAYLSIVERENQMRAAADEAAATGDSNSADAAQAAADAAAMAQDAADVAAMASDVTAKKPTLRIGRRNSSDGELQQHSIFRPHDTIRAELEMTYKPRQKLRARWTFGADNQLVWQETGAMPAGHGIADFHINNPGGFPVGTYEVTISSDEHGDITKNFCIEDAGSICREIVGYVYSYVTGGKRTYSSVLPPDAKNVRTIRYSYFNVSPR